MSETVQRQVHLPLRKAVGIAWRNIRVRFARSILVTSGIILALAFLMYVLASNAILQAIASLPANPWIELLRKEGAIRPLGEAAASQTWWLVGLALMVSFVGILNAMLMSVTERFAEIGTMKCLGALDSFVIKLFLLESVFQGVSGTVLGILIGTILAVVEGTVTFYRRLAGEGPWAGLERVFGAMPGVDLLRFTAICVVVGVLLTVFGALYPAWRAAKMQPVEAMRAEV